jgi:hypothetical protein
MFRFDDFSPLHIGENALGCESVTALRIAMRSLLRWHGSQCVEHRVGLSLRLHPVEACHIWIAAVCVSIVLTKSHPAVLTRLHTLESALLLTILVETGLLRHHSHSHVIVVVTHVHVVPGRLRHHLVVLLIVVHRG